MTNAFYDDAKPAPYRGALRICPECGAVVADDRRGRHEQWHEHLNEDLETTVEVTEWQPATEDEATTPEGRL